jgi:hypothetical protein
VAHSTSYPRASPDGSRIGFLSTDEGRQPLGLYVADLVEADLQVRLPLQCSPRRITRVDSAHAFAWAPDGRSIARRSSRWWITRLFGDLFRVDVESGAMTRLTRSARLALRMCTSGRTIVAVRTNDRSRLVTVDAGSESLLTEFSATAWGPALVTGRPALAAMRFTRGVSFDLG